MIHMIGTGFGMVGACMGVWIGMRVVATGVDIFQRWRRARKGDRNAWKVDGEE